MDLYPIYYAKALRFLSFRPRSEKEVREYLQKPTRKKFDTKQEPLDEQIVERIVSQLKEQKFLDDQAFASWWVEQRTRVKPKGKLVIKMELSQKGISADLIEQALHNDDLQQQGKEQIKKIVRRKLEQLHGVDKRTAYQKIGAFMMRRGYDFATAKQVIDEVMKETV